MKIAICDDEPLIREQMKTLIGTLTADVPDLFASGMALLNADTRYDLIFLDVEMEELSGIETARRIRTREAETHARKSCIIFVTAYASYVEDAFDVEAFHYLVKPPDAERLSRVFRKAAKEIHAQQTDADRSVLIKAGGSMRRILIRDITFVESNNKKVLVHTTHEVVETYAKMREMETLLGSAFFRCHRCYLVNLAQVTSYNADTATVRGGDVLLISGKKYSLFVKALLRHVKEGGHHHAPA